MWEVMGYPGCAAGQYHVRDNMQRSSPTKFHDKQKIIVEMSSSTSPTSPKSSTSNSPIVRIKRELKAASVRPSTAVHTDQGY